jgi:hypothetical protein
MNTKTIKNSTNNLSNNLDNFLDKINSKKKSNLIFEKYDQNQSDEQDESAESVDSVESEEQVESEEIDQLEIELESNIMNGLPKNFGTKWLEEEILTVLAMLKKHKIKDLSESNKTIIRIANKLNRSIGGVFGIIKKTVSDKYINGADIEEIATELNLTFQTVKSIIKSYLIKDSDNIINLLEKENKLLKLKIENIKLKKELKEINK